MPEEVNDINKRIDAAREMLKQGVPQPRVPLELGEMSERAKSVQAGLRDNRADVVRLMRGFRELSFAIHPASGAMIIANPSYEEKWQVALMLETGETTWGHKWAFKHFLGLDYEEDNVEAMHFVFGHMHWRSEGEFDPARGERIYIDIDMTRGNVSFDDVIMSARRLTEPGPDDIPYISPESRVVIAPGHHKLERQAFRNLGELAAQKLSTED